MHACFIIIYTTKTRIPPTVVSREYIYSLDTKVRGILVFIHMYIRVMCVASTCTLDTTHVHVCTQHLIV